MSKSIKETRFLLRCVEIYIACATYDTTNVILKCRLKLWGFLSIRSYKKPMLIDASRSGRLRSASQLGKLRFEYVDFES